MSKLEEIVENIIREPNDSTYLELVSFFLKNNVDDEDICLLARKLAESGDVLDLPDSDLHTDIPSTGGPSSLSTIVCPLFIVALGHSVPKLAVSGRPAGGIDIMAQIPGYKISFDDEEVRTILKECGYAHFWASDRFAPLDGALYKFRKKVSAVDIPELAIASLLSKKLAVGLNKIGLEIRVAPHGNFGATQVKARNNARRFIRVASKLGINAICFLTDAKSPYQPYIGRGEALLALYDIFNGASNNEWLMNHLEMCFRMAERVTEVDENHNKLFVKNTASIRDIFAKHLKAQGSDYILFSQKVKSIRSAERRTVCAGRDGYVDIDLAEMRKQMVKAQSVDALEGESFPDPVGVILFKNTGDYVDDGELLASIRRYDNINNNIIEGIIGSISLTDTPCVQNYFEEIISG